MLKAYKVISEEPYREREIKPCPVCGKMDQARKLITYKEKQKHWYCWRCHVEYDERRVFVYMQNGKKKELRRRKIVLTNGVKKEINAVNEGRIEGFLKFTLHTGKEILFNIEHIAYIEEV